MKLIHKSLSICIILALCLIGMPAVAVDARPSAGEPGTDEWTAPLPPGVTRADWEQIRALLAADLPGQQAYLKASNTGATDSFGLAVAISGDTIVVGAYDEDSNATGVNGDQSNNSAVDAGAAYVFIRNGTTWSQQAYLKASNTEAYDGFGVSVAISGDTIVVGAPFEDSNATGVNGDQSDNSAGAAGAAYVFLRNGGTWSQQAYLKASNTGGGDTFGSSVAISGDTIVVGAPDEDSNATGVNGDQSDNSAYHSGAAYVFFRNGGIWSQQAYLKASNTERLDTFGSSVAISGDTIVVGGLYEDSNATGVNGDQNNNLAVDAGAAYVFLRNGGIWSQQAYLKASNTGADDWFGVSVAISGDTIVVGAFFEDSNATGVNGDQSDNSAIGAGAAYVFLRNGETWSQQAYLKASNTERLDTFGYSVAISGDTIVVATPYEASNATGVNGDQSNNSAPSAGAAYVFLRNGTTWSQQAYLKASNTEATDSFGLAVAISGDTIVVGAYWEDSNATGVNGDQNNNSASDSGAAYVFFTPPLMPTNTDVYIGGIKRDSYYVPPHGSMRKSFAGVNNGPVQISNTQGTSMIAAERVIYKVNGVDTSFSEMMGLPNNQLDNIYWLAWYNNVDLDTQLRFANVSESPAAVHVYIGGTEMPGSPFTLAVGASTRKSFAGVNGGPVRIESNVDIVAAERVIYKVNGVNTSFSEMMGLPNSQLDNIYWLPWYNNVDLDAQLRFANVSGSPATVHVFVGGTEMPGSPFTLAVGASTRKSFPAVNGGPVKIESNVNIVAAQRVIYKVNGLNTSFSEMMGLPNNQLDNIYWLPWYNNVDLDTQLRFANVSGSLATVHVYIGNIEMPGSPFTLAAGASIRKSFAGINKGPVKIESNVDIVAAERVIHKVNGVDTSFSEMMGLPDSQLDISYWLPWYNNMDLDTQLRFGIP